MVTVPPPYSPFGISPANLKYSSGWSSTWTARWFFLGSGGTPLGTAHETPTPSFSSRKSQWSRRAWCSWTTNRGDRAAFFGTRASGSGVFLKSLLASYSASFFATRKRLGHDRCQLLEVHLQADPLGRDLTRPEGTVRGEAFELGRGIGAPLEHLESRLRRKRAEPSEIHSIDLALYVGVGRVPAHVLDHRRPAGAKDPVHLGERAARLREVLERRLADHQVEGAGFERHLGHIALAEFDGHPGLAGVFAADLDECPADVETCHLNPSTARHLDRQVSRARRDLEHSGTVWQTRGEEESLLPVRLELALRTP